MKISRPGDELRRFMTAGNNSFMHLTERNKKSTYNSYEEKHRNTNWKAQSIDLKKIL
jgi:hypothetical protein